jgi:hypothetical protein
VHPASAARVAIASGNPYFRYFTSSSQSTVDPPGAESPPQIAAGVTATWLTCNPPTYLQVGHTGDTTTLGNPR